MKCFESYHPIILLFYFAVVIFVTMFTLNPVLVAISLFSSILFCFILKGGKKMAKTLIFSLPMFLIFAISNPLFSHKGETILFFLNGNPVTKEAIIYGIFSAMMIMAVFYWFSCFNEVMTSDKYVYIFGRIVPKISLLLSMTLRFVPQFTIQYRKIDDSQRALGIYATNSILDKIKNKTRVVSILITCSLENSIETADSMRARGQGLKGRTSYSIFKWTKKDTIFGIIFMVLIATAFLSLFTGVAEFYYYPTITALSFTFLDVMVNLSLLAVMILPAILEIKENIKWRYLKSKI